MAWPDAVERAVLDALPGAFWLTDEALPGARPAAALTHRWDVAQALAAEGVAVQWADYPADFVADGSQDRVVLRVPKEKALALHWLDCAGRWLKPGGELVLVGRKSEGAPSLIKRVRGAWDRPGTVTNHGPWRVARFVRGPRVEALGDGDYARIRPVAERHGVALLSKPGVFAWKGVDAGTEALLALLERRGLAPRGAWADLGCGSGLLAAWLAARGADSVLATDSSAAALMATGATLRPWFDRVQLAPSDAGAGLPGGHAGILSNPPFHRGFETDRDLTDAFVAAARAMLAPDGEAWFVVNAFVPVPDAAAAHFGVCQLVEDDKRYRIYRLAEPR